MPSESIIEIRKELQRIGNHSHTSFSFQDDIIDAILSGKDFGDSVIEVGCYRGGLTVQLAATCRALQKRFYVVDISKQFLKIAQETVETVIGNQPDIVYFTGTLTDLFSSGKVTERPILIFIDGDHRYAGVVKDITAIMNTDNPPYAVAFHDFSLRYTTPEFKTVRVDKAIFDTLGQDVPFKSIGEVAGTGATLATTPRANGAYHERGYPEGVLILCEQMRRAN